MRKCMREHDDVVPNQVGKPVKNPTMKWIAELMNMIAVVTLISDGKKHRIVTNVKKCISELLPTLVSMPWKFMACFLILKGFRLITLIIKIFYIDAKSRL